jgi:hypothetical protein
MKKQSLTIILLLLVALSFGCSTGEPKRYDVDIHTGTQGLVLRFLPQTPPAIVYSGESMDIQIEVSNKGAYEVNNGLLYLTGFDKSIIDVGYEFVDIPTIGGKAEYMREGGKNVVSLSSILNHEISVGLPSGVDGYDTKIEAIACYYYKTTATIPICIDANPRIDTHDACRPTSVSGGSQGAPVAVSNVQVEPGYGKLRLILTLNNVGNGVIIDEESCPFGYKYGELGNIESLEVNLKGIDLLCNPDTVKLSGGSAKVYCHADISDLINTGAYKTPLTIDFEYGYKTAISTSLEIRKGMDEY